MSGNILFETSKWRDIVELGLCMVIYDVCNYSQFENCTPLDFANFLNVREEAKDDEQRKEDAAQAEKIAYALEYFTKKSPDIQKNMQGMVSQLNAWKFASVLREELRKAADDMAQIFTSKIEPMVIRAESAERRISVPTMAAYIILAILVWQIIFLVMYANTIIRSGDLTALIVLFFVAVIISIIAIIYFTKKYKW